MNDEMSASQIARSDLHKMMDDLLDNAEKQNGRFDMDGLWHFVAALAQGRGVKEMLHNDGLEAASAVNKSPANDFNHRQKRAYHIAVTASLIAAIGRLPDQPSFLPANYNHGVIIHDLMDMLRGKSGLGEGTPLILYSEKEGEAGLRRAVRRLIVGVVRWRMGATRKTRTEVWGDLMSDADGRNGDDDANPTKLDRWQNEFGGVNGGLCQTAFEAGKNKQTVNGWNRTNEELSEIIALARSGQGKRSAKPKPTKP